FDIKGQLPDTKKLSGIRSQEVGGTGFNQLRFDDTTGQISSQLQSSHGASQLNLGNLSHPKAVETSDGRGEGFELRTDQYGAVRAGKGLLISTHPQDQASANHLSTNEAKTQLQSSLNNSEALSQIAKNQLTDPLDVLDNLQAFLEHIESGEKEKVDSFKQALMLLAAPNSIALATNKDIHLSADQQINHSAGDSINLSTQKSLIGHASQKISLFAAQEGFRAFAAKGKVELQAQDDAIEAIARKVIKLISTEDKIEMISPKEIVLTAGGSQLKINGEGVFTTTGGKFESKAGQHSFVGGARVKTETPTLPIVQDIKIFTNKWDFYDLFYEANFSDVKYKLINNQNNNYISGALDEHGRTQRMNAYNNEDYDILIGTDDEWTVSMDDESEDQEIEHICNSYHNNEEEEG
ncbi:MAG: DUF2345 domain-containing protein, partial [Kurthia sp.]|nr:DUF2345 domain-containing protein [Candidatus Kurthia equi]